MAQGEDTLCLLCEIVHDGCPAPAPWPMPRSALLSPPLRTLAANLAGSQKDTRGSFSPACQRGQQVAEQRGGMQHLRSSAATRHSTRQQPGCMARPPTLQLHSTHVAIGASLTGCEQEVRVALGRHIINWRIAEHVAVRLLCNEGATNVQARCS